MLGIRVILFFLSGCGQYPRINKLTKSVFFTYRDPYDNALPNIFGIVRDNEHATT